LITAEPECTVAPAACMHHARRPSVCHAHYTPLQPSHSLHTSKYLQMHISASAQHFCTHTVQ